MPTYVGHRIGFLVTEMAANSQKTSKLLAHACSCVSSHEVKQICGPLGYPFGMTAKVSNSDACSL